MPLYEHVYLARQDISAQQVESMTQGFQEIITSNGGKLEKTEYWGLRSLSYRIKKNRKAHYTLINIDAPYDAVAEMERQMRLSTDVIRFLTIRVDEHDPNLSPILKKNDREDRKGGSRRDHHDRFSSKRGREKHSDSSKDKDNSDKEGDDR